MKCLVLFWYLYLITLPVPLPLNAPPPPTHHRNFVINTPFNLIKAWNVLDTKIPIKETKSNSLGFKINMFTYLQRAVFVIRMNFVYKFVQTFYRCNEMNCTGNALLICTVSSSASTVGRRAKVGEILWLDWIGNISDIQMVNVIIWTFHFLWIPFIWRYLFLLSSETN